MPLFNLSGNWTTTINSTQGVFNIRDVNGDLTGDFGSSAQQLMGKFDVNSQRLFLMSTPLNDPNGATVYSGDVSPNVVFDPQGFGDIFTLEGTFTSFPGSAGGQGSTGSWSATFLEFME